MQRGGDPQRPVEARREVDLGAHRADRDRGAEQPGDPPAAADLQAHGVGRPGQHRAGLRGGLVHRDPRRPARAPRAARPRRGTAPPRARARRPPATRWPSRPPRVPCPVCVESQRHRRSAAARTAAIRPASSPMPTLTFRSESPSGPPRASAAAPARSNARIVALTSTSPAGSLASRAATGRPRAARAGPRGRGRARPAPEGGRRPRATRRAGRRAPFPALRPARAVGLQRLAHQRERDAVVGLQRRRLAPADQPGGVADPYVEQLAALQRAPTGSRAACAGETRAARRTAPCASVASRQFAGACGASPPACAAVSSPVPPAQASSPPTPTDDDASRSLRPNFRLTTLAQQQTGGEQHAERRVAACRCARALR